MESEVLIRNILYLCLLVFGGLLNVLWLDFHGLEELGHLLGLLLAPIFVSEDSYSIISSNYSSNHIK